MYPVLFHIGSFPVRAYGTLVVIGFLIAVWRTMQVCARRQVTEPEGSPRRIHPDAIFDISLYGLFFSLLGARLAFVALDWANFAQRPAEIFKLWEGGLSLHGAMLGAILTMVVYCRRKKLSFLAVSDLGAVGWSVAYAFGRIGCFLNGCCYGGVCDLPWAVRFRDEHSLTGALTPPSHPVQLYGTLINLVFFAILIWWEKRPRRDGEIFYGYIALYGVYRYAMEAFRAGTTSTYLIPSLHLTDTHIISLVMIAIGVGAIAWLRRTRPLVPAPSATSPMPAPAP